MARRACFACSFIVPTQAANLSHAPGNFGCVQAKSGLTQPNLGLAQAKLGPAQPNLGLVQAKLGLAQPNLGLVQAKLGLAQPNLGCVQANLGLAQPNFAKKKCTVHDFMTLLWCPYGYETSK